MEYSLTLLQITTYVYLFLWNILKYQGVSFVGMFYKSVICEYIMSRSEIQLNIANITVNFVNGAICGNYFVSVV